jgi:hypothetical protein
MRSVPCILFHAFCSMHSVPCILIVYYSISVTLLGVATLISKCAVFFLLVKNHNVINCCVHLPAVHNIILDIGRKMHCTVNALRSVTHRFAIQYNLDRVLHYRTGEIFKFVNNILGQTSPLSSFT